MGIDALMAGTGLNYASDILTVASARMMSHAREQAVMQSNALMEMLPAANPGEVGGLLDVRA